MWVTSNLGLYLATLLVGGKTSVFFLHTLSGKQGVPWTGHQALLSTAQVIQMYEEIRK